VRVLALPALLLLLTMLLMMMLLILMMLPLPLALPSSRAPLLPRLPYSLQVSWRKLGQLQRQLQRQLPASRKWELQRKDANAGTAIAIA